MKKARLLTKLVGRLPYYEKRQEKAILLLSVIILLFLMINPYVNPLEHRSFIQTILTWEEEPRTPQSLEGKIWIKVDGSVRKPGTYLLDEGERVADALKIAGVAPLPFLMAEKDLDQYLVSGDKIIYSEKDVSNPVTLSRMEGGTLITLSIPININTAQVKDLDAIPHIGRTIASRIVQYRETNGTFHTLDDLLKVKGIGEKKFNKIKGYMTY